MVLGWVSKLLFGDPISAAPCYKCRRVGAPTYQLWSEIPYSHSTHRLGQRKRFVFGSTKATMSRFWPTVYTHGSASHPALPLSASAAGCGCVVQHAFGSEAGEEGVMPTNQRQPRTAARLQPCPRIARIPISSAPIQLGDELSTGPPRGQNAGLTPH